MMNVLKISLMSFVLIFAVGIVVLAQEEEIEKVVTEAVNLDENIQPGDLEVSEPRLLPDSPFYFLKNWGREIRSFLTFNPTARAELRLRFANEKLMEAKKLVAEGKSREIIERGIENYQEEIEKIKATTEKIKEKAAENPKVGEFLDKFITHQVLHQKVLEKLETQVPPEVFEKIKAARERHLERFGEVMQKLEDKTRLPERLGKNLEELKGSKFKYFKNLEILKGLEEKVPEEAKEAIRNAQENALKRLQGDLEKMSPEDQERFKEYLEKISGNRERQMEILENLKIRIKEAPETPEVLKLREKLEEGKIKIFEKIEEKLKNLDCPLFPLPPPGFCKEGRVIIEKDEKGCPLLPKCIVPGEVEIPPRPEKPGVCITLWDPVCGKDGKTYSNACFAKLAGVEIASKGKCLEKECETDANCPQLRCGPAGARCIGVRSKCVEGKCQIVPIR